MVFAMMLAYHVPEYMPLAVPFAFNGGGTFYMFDMRSPPVNGEYPIVCCGSGRWGSMTTSPLPLPSRFLTRALDERM